MKWFKHETNANQDSKLERVRIKYGMEGYGLYWYCLELIGQSVEAHNLTFELEHDAEIIAARTSIHYERVQEMMAYMIDLGLFESDGAIVTCLKMAIRADEYTQKALRKLTKEGGSPDKLLTQSVEDQDCVRTLSGETPEKVPSNRKNRKIFTPPSLQEVADYCYSRSNSVDPSRFLDYYGSVNWMRGKNKIKDWKAVVRTWERNDQKPTTDSCGGEVWS